MNTRYISRCKCDTITSGLLTDDGLRAARENDTTAWHKANPAPTGIHLFMGSFCLTCRGCGHKRYAKMVKGIVNHAHKCNDKCMSSRGFSCECSCGGKNHGAAYSAA
jgi:hypothetical protein